MAKPNPAEISVGHAEWRCSIGKFVVRARAPSLAKWFTVVVMVVVLLGLLLVIP